MEILLSLVESEPETRFQFKPNHTSSWVGSNSDLVELSTKPALLNDVCTNNECPLTFCNDPPLPHPSSRNNYFNAIKLPKLNKGLRHLVKMQGAELRPKKTVKPKYLTVPEKIQEKKKQKCLMIWEDIKMVITRLKIKTEKEITLVDIW